MNASVLDPFYVTLPLLSSLILIMKKKKKSKQQMVVEGDITVSVGSDTPQAHRGVSIGLSPGN